MLLSRTERQRSLPGWCVELHRFAELPNYSVDPEKLKSAASLCAERTVLAGPWKPPGILTVTTELPR